MAILARGLLSSGLEEDLMLSSVRSRSSSKVVVALGFDDGYVPHAAAVIASIARASDPAAFRFLLLNTGVSKDRQAQLESSAPGAEFDWIEVGSEHLPELKVKGSVAHINRATFLRLALERVAPADCDRVIYLDADLVVTGDLRDLWAVDMAGAVVAGVHDHFIKPADFAHQWALPSPTLGYFNAGVLLIDLKQVREERLFSKAVAFVLANNPAFADQDALNWALWNRWRAVDLVWNVGRHLAIDVLILEVQEDRRLNGRAPKIVHFTGPEKPWLNTGYHPWAWLYWRALRDTSFEREVSENQSISTLKKVRLWLRWLIRRYS
ncbi:MAG: glycosyltransferase family 8 protein [Hyphomonadaceae bacterium]|nr:glycosyltransferase family 8 protein [Hyphomonadaceae bacterium]